MRKIFSILSALALSSVSSLSIIACQNQFNDPNVYRITIVTDGHTITDHSFNESSYNGALQFKREFNAWSHSSSANDSLYKNKRVEVSWDNPQLTTLDNLMTSYNKAVFINSEVIVASGFLHHDALVRSQNGVLKHKTKFVFVDGDTPNTEVPRENKQLAGLLYKAEQSGFLAGLAGAIWLVANHEKYDSNGLKMSTFGGLPAQTIVSYMMGYYWGVYYLNNYRTNPDLLKMVNDIRTKNSISAIGLSAFTSQYQISFDKIPTQFTGGFDSGSKQSKAITSQLIDFNREDIVMPVAGAQTVDLLSAIKSSSINNNAKVIGVDVDQTKQYEYAKNMFITSALKGIHASVSNWLWYAFNLNYEKSAGLPIITASDGSKYFTQPQAALGGAEGYTGICDNDPIDVIYNKLISKPYQLLANKVTSAFNVLSNDLTTDTNKNKWENAWQTKIDGAVEKYKPKF